jgi:hypothetical protein
MGPQYHPCHRRAECLAAVTDVDVALMLSDHYRWTAAQIESWMISTVRMLLIDPESR